MRALLFQLFGSPQWQAPPWWQWCRAHKGKALAGLLALLLMAAAAWGGWYWYQHRPQPQLLHFSVEAPALTDYHKDKAVVAPLTLAFSASVAPLDAIGKPVSAGVSLSPALNGQWHWASDKHLQFQPDGDWPVGQAFSVQLDEGKLLAKGIQLDRDKAGFETAPFSAAIQEARLYQDPRHPEIQQLVATLAFSHPVDTASVQPRLSLLLGPGLSYQGSTAPELSFDDKHLFAYLHSAPLAMPLDSTRISLEMDKGIRAAAGGNEAGKASQAVAVPGRYQLSFDGAEIHFAINDNQQAEPVLTMESSKGVSDQALQGKVHAWLLPKKNPKGDDYWYEENTSEAVLAQSLPLELTQIPGAEGLNQLHSFKFKAPVGRYLAVRVDKQVEGQGGYLSRQASFSVLRMPEYPQALQFLGDGALLSLKGDRRLGYLARGVGKVQLEVAQLLPGQLAQLVDQRNGSFAKPNLDNQAFDRLVTRTLIKQALPVADPGQTQYGSLDLGPFLKDRRGIFVVKLTPAAEKDDQTFDYYQSEAHDLRFLVVTDLGILAKRSRDGSQDLFVQSLASGQPVAGAQVAVIGRNGQPVAEAQTDDQGHARFAKLDQLRREKTPLLYRVEKDGDLSFLPIGDWRRHLDLSRFDTGGAGESDDPKALGAYLFTDRGLYRPGETVHIASLVKGQDWATPLEGLPVKLTVLDPRGLKVLDRTFQLDGSGFSSLDFTSGEVAPAGDYQARLSLIRDKHRLTLLGSVGFKVRDFEPDRIKVRLALAGADKTGGHPPIGWLKPAEVQALVQAEQLFGGPAGKRRVTGEMLLSPTDIGFPLWPGYRFGVQGKLKESFRDQLADAETDDKGQAQLQLALDRFEGSTYKLHLLARVMEAGSGRGVSAQAEALVSNAELLLGYKADGDLGFIAKGGERHVRLQAVGQDLKGVATAVQAERIERRWVSVLIKQQDGSYRYESRRKDISLGSQPLALAADGLDLALDTQAPGDHRLRFSDAQGRQLGQLDYSVAGKGNASRALDRNAELNLKLDKGQYQPGDDIQVAIQAPYSGAGLITIERDKVYAFKWFKMDGTRSVQQIRLPAGIEGNAYVNVQFLRAPDSDQIFMSPLSYAVAPFQVDLGARRQALALTAPAQLQPGQTLDLDLDLPQAGKVLVFGVDEGILQVARYQAPDPLGHFFAKKALSVDSSQILDLLLPDLKLLMRSAAPGGDAAALLAANLNPFKRKHAAPVVYWSGIQQLAAGHHRFQYPVPDSFNGKLHLFAVSVAPNSMGATQGAVQVKGPLVLSPNAPTFLAPGDQSQVALGLYNTQDKPLQVALLLEASPGLKLLDGAQRQLTIAPGQEARARFQVQATASLGEARLHWTASTGQGGFQRTETLSVRPASPYRTALRTGMLEDDQQQLAPQRDLYAPFAKQEAGLAASPLLWAQGLKAYLGHYPHACTEQLVSKAVPAIFLGTAADNQASFEQLLDQLRSRQNGDGGFGLWAANPVVEPMVALYVVDMLLDARQQGYPVPQDMLDRADSYLSGLSNGPSDGLAELRERAYGAYLLARQGVRVSGALADIRERLQRRYPKNWQADIASAWLAASFTLMQQQELAQPLWDAQQWQLLSDKPQRLGVYLGPLVHDAQLLTLLARHAPQRLAKLPEALLPKMGQWLSDQNYSSLSAGTLIRALSTYGDRAQSGNLALSAQVKSAWQALALPLAALPAGTDQLKLEKSGQAPAFYLVTEAGFDKTPPAPFSQGLEVSRDYLDLAGKPLAQVKLGQEFLVRLRLRATALDSLAQVAITDLLPGGVEPVPRDAGDDFHGWQPPVGVAKLSDWRPQWLNLREDRLVLYGTASRDAATFVYKVRATNVGRYLVPPPYAQGLYDPRQQALGQGGELVIVAP
ncbi:MG2 domain-containing protein [Gallaecimonas kandeliae]|uniref:MG2 domain-containing protein n=1 Tax=Gallaecimonas kandeliae TaxID=3029055 RepID=UPI0026498CAA|nr:MG2 domain-containing protein [Gallaecimonas kandeliae]WKE65535.1 MG2 domain-containing protein [Gallaecimonas kandeliae]